MVLQPALQFKDTLRFHLKEDMLLPACSTHGLHAKTEMDEDRISSSHAADMFWQPALHFNGTSRCVTTDATAFLANSGSLASHDLKEGYDTPFQHASLD